MADVIVGLVEKPRLGVYLGTSGRMLGLLHTLAPGLGERLTAMLVEWVHFQDHPARPTEGNLFHPMSQWTTVSGG